MAPKDHAKTDADEDILAALLPEVRPVRLGKVTIDVRELTLEQMSLLVDHFRPLVGAIKGNTTIDMLSVMVQSKEAAYAVAQATTGLPKSYFVNAGDSKLAIVVTAAVEVNLPFFVQCIELAMLVGALMRTPSGDGQTPATTSSPADTPAP